MLLEELQEYVKKKGNYGVIIYGEFSEEFALKVHQRLEAGADLPNTFHFMGSCFSIWPAGKIHNK